MEVGFSDLAIRSLSNIAYYVGEYFGMGKADEVVGRIISRAISLGKNPRIGQRAEEWLDYGEIRCLTYGQNQIYYIIEGDNIAIIVVWDTRQSPLRLRQLVASFLRSRK